MPWTRRTARLLASSLAHAPRSTFSENNTRYVSAKGCRLARCEHERAASAQEVPPDTTTASGSQSSGRQGSRVWGQRGQATTTRRLGRGRSRPAAEGVTEGAGGVLGRDRCRWHTQQAYPAHVCRAMLGVWCKESAGNVHSQNLFVSTTGILKLDLKEDPLRSWVQGTAGLRDERPQGSASWDSSDRADPPSST